MWIKITDPFRWSPPELNNTWSQVYQPGEYNVTRACADAAVAQGKGVKFRKTGKNAEAADGE